MGIYVGADKIKSLYVGENKIVKAYTGDFLVFSAVPSRLPAGYTEVEYIKGSSNGNSNYRPYLSIPNTTGAVRLKFAFSAGDQAQMNRTYCNFVLGKNRSTGTAANALRWYGLGASNGKIHYDYGVNAYQVDSIAAVAGTKYDIDIRESEKKLFVNGSVSILSGTSSWVSKEFTVFYPTNVNNSYHSITAYTLYPVTLYYLQLLDANGNLLRDLVPCKNSSGEAGMYDLITDTFFENVNTSSVCEPFTAGPAV